MDTISIAVIGMGKIARDRHLPALAGDTAFEFAATISPHDSGVSGVAHHESFDELLAQGPVVDAIAFCTPRLANGGLWIGPDSLLPNVRGFRSAIVCAGIDDGRPTVRSAAMLTIQ